MTCVRYTCSTVAAAHPWRRLQGWRQQRRGVCNVCRRHRGGGLPRGMRRLMAARKYQPFHLQALECFSFGKITQAVCLFPSVVLRDSAADIRYFQKKNLSLSNCFCLFFHRLGFTKLFNCAVSRVQRRVGWTYLAICSDQSGSTMKWKKIECVSNTLHWLFLFLPLLRVVPGDLRAVEDLPAQHRTDQRHQVRLSFHALRRTLFSRATSAVPCGWMRSRVLSRTCKPQEMEGSY